MSWSVAGEISARIVTPITFLILARLLTPADFGVVAAATMVISFSQIFWEAGMAKAVVQRQGDVVEAANVAFWTNIVLGLLVSGALLTLSDVIAVRIFHDGRVGDVLKLLTVQVMLAAIVSTPMAMLQREFLFKRIFAIRVATTMLPGLAAIPLALSELGYWSLVYGAILGQVVQLLVLWRLSPWRPAFSFEKRIAADLVRFGAWVGLSGLLAWFYTWADALVVGAFLGSTELGLFRTGSQFASMIFGLLFAPLLPVAYSYLSRLRAETAVVRAALLEIMRLTAIVALPAAFVIAAVAEPATDIILGAKWDGVGVVLATMALMQGFAWIVGFDGEAYRALGKPHLETIVTGTSLVVYLVGYLISIQFGLEAFLWTRLGLSLCAAILHLSISRRLLGLRYRDSLRIVGVSLLLGAALGFLVTAPLQPWPVLTRLASAAGAAITAAAILLRLWKTRWFGQTITLLRSPRANS